MWKRGPWWAPLLVALWIASCGSGESTQPEGDIATDSLSSIDSATLDAVGVDGVIPTEDGASGAQDGTSGSEDGASGSGDTTQVEGDVGDSATSPDSVEPFVPGWQIEALGDPGELSSLFVINANEAYAVGGSHVVRYNGKAWSSFGLPGEVTLHGIWAADGEVVVVGDAGFIARRTTGELAWTVEESGTFQHLRAVHGRGPDDVWAAGNDGVILHYAGAEAGWALVDQTSNIDLYGIHVDPEQEGNNGVVTCGTGGRLVLHDSGVWKTSHVASGEVILQGLFGIDGRLFAVGTGGTVSVREGETGSWVGQPTNLSKDRDLYAVGASDTDEVYAFGEAGTVLRWLGTSWQQIQVGTPTHSADDFVGAAWAKGVDDGEGHWLVIGSGGGGVTSPDASTWSDMSTQPLAGLTGLAAEEDGRLWATGRDGVLMARDQDGWSSVGTGTTHDLFGLTVSDNGEIWMVGEEGTVIVRTVDGDMNTVAVPAFSDLLSVHSESELTIIGGKGGTLLRRAGDEDVFTPWTIGMTTDVRAITRGGDGALWIAGGFGKLYRSEDGETAVPVPSGVSGGLSAMAATEDGVLIVGDNGVVLDADGAGEVTLLYEQSELFLYGVSIAGGYTVAVGWNGTALHLVDGDIVIEDTGAHQVLEAVWHDGTRAIAVGRVGHAYTRMEAP
ncbi:MAG: hypothetical protein QF464_00740 [Myxococcota bacterium]|nr:hypothetical protein [Myxococcota bacterium]